MIRIVLVLCLASVALGRVLDLPTPHDFISAVQDLQNGAEITEDFESRIVGGSTASPGQFPYQAGLRTSANGHFCGGFVANNRWVVSAAHCTVGRTTGNTIVVLGAHSRTTGGTTFSLSRIVNHPDYNAATIAWDVSVVQTSNTIAFTNLIQPIPLGSNHIGGGLTAVVSGWGLTSSPGSMAANLQFLHVQTLTNAACRTALGASGSLVFDHKICAGGVVGQGVCSTDSGGPLALGNTAIGIVSWGIPCARGFPDGYDRVSSHRTWILAQF
ncbi:chymotrypsin-2-like [Phlebotomus papatasi]|uniref:chymotrypsin-2-like n=1 Tax=Phlebotomus papatasi TaxID=29031 RepID=UPI0024843863|nr:chymotrypsin-2-like [Phlebotomus papatasi]